MFQPSCRHPPLQSDTGGTVFLSRLGVRPGGFLFWAMFGIRGGVAFSRGVACSWADGLFGTGPVFLGPTGLLLACCSCSRRGLDIHDLAWCSVAATPVDVCRCRCRAVGGPARNAVARRGRNIPLTTLQSLPSHWSSLLFYPDVKTSRLPTTYIVSQPQGL